MTGLDISRIERIVQSVVQAALTPATSNGSRNATHAATASQAADNISVKQKHRESSPAQSLDDLVRVSPEARRHLAEVMFRELVRVLTTSTAESNAETSANDVSNAIPKRQLTTPAQNAVATNEEASRPAPKVDDQMPLAKAISSLLSDPGLRQQLEKLLAQADIQKQMPNLLRNPSLQEVVLRLLKNESFSRQARAIFSSAEAGSLIRLLISQPSTQSDILALLAQNGILNRALPALNPIPEARVMEQLAGQPQGRLLIGQLLQQDPDTQLQVIQALAEFSDPKILSQLLSQRGIGSTAPHLLGNEESTRAFLRLLDQPGMANVKNQIFSRMDVQNTLAAFLSSDDIRMPVLGFLNGMNPDVLQSILNRKDIQNAIANILGKSEDAESIAQSIRLLRQTASPRITEAVFTRQDIQGRIIEYFEIPQTRADTLQLLQVTASQIGGSRLLNLPQVLNLLQQMLKDRDAQQAALQVLRTATGQDAARRIFSNQAMTTILDDIVISSDNVELQRSALQILNQPYMAHHLPKLISSTQFQEAIPSLIENEGTRDETIRFLAAIGDSARQILSSPKMQEALSRGLTGIPENPLLIDLLRKNELAKVLLQSLQSVKDKNALARILQQPGMQNALVDLFQNGQTQPEILQILSRLGSSNVLNSIMSRHDLQNAILDAIQNGQSLDQMQQFLRLPQFRLLLQNLLLKVQQIPENSQNTYKYLTSLLPQVGGTQWNSGSTAKANKLDSQAMQSQLRHMLAPGLLQSEVFHANPLGPTTLIDRLLSERASLSEAPQIAFSNLRVLLQRMLGPLSAPSTNHPAGSLTDLIRLLEHSLSRLHSISPERANNALRTVALLSQLGGNNQLEVLRQISEKLDRLSNALALKGGLPATLREPILSESSLIMLRFDGLPRDSFLALTRWFLHQGIQITFIGRSSTGAAQIHIQMAEPPSATLKQGFQNVPPVIHLPSLRAGEGEAFLRMFGSADPYSLHQNDSSEQSSKESGAGYRASLAQDSITALTSRQILQNSEARIFERNDSYTGSQIEGISHFQYNYHLAALFPWFSFTTTVSSRVHILTKPADKEIIPTFLDLIADEPLLLPYYPNEILIPGTNIPLILPREVDSNMNTIQDAEVLSE